MLYLLRKKAWKPVSKYCIAIGFALIAQFSNAQQNDLNLPDHDSKPYYFGITLGVNLSRFQTEFHPKFLQDDSVYVAEPLNSGGFSLGLSATTRLSNRFEFRFNPQLVFTERNFYYVLKYPEFDLGTKVTKKVESV